MDPVDEAEGAIRWSRVEDTFVVGSIRGNFVGYIDQTSPTTFEPHDQVSRQLETAGSLEEAMSSLSALYFAARENGVSDVVGR